VDDEQSLEDETVTRACTTDYLGPHTCIKLITFVCRHHVLTIVVSNAAKYFRTYDQFEANR
jgi:hypothetical protein